MRTTQRALLAAVVALLLAQGCGTGSTESGPSAEYSGAPHPNSGAAGSGVSSGAGAGARTTR